MKSLVLVALLVLSSCIPLITFPDDEYFYEKPVYDLAELFKGVVNAWKDRGEDVVNMELCSDNASHIEDYLQEIYEAIKDLNSKEIKVVIRALREILENVENIIDSVIPCVESIAELKVMFDRVIYLDPIEFLWRCFNNLIQNTDIINKDVKALVEAYKNSDWYGVGYSIGDMIEIIIFKKHEPEAGQERMREFFNLY